MKLDQAHLLRQLTKAIPNKGPKITSKSKTTRVVTIASGKGGVGKSNFAINFALSLSALGKKVVLIDLDIGMANIDILMGMNSKYHLLDMIEKRKSIWDVLEKGAGQLEYLSGGTGFNHLFQLHEDERQYFFHELEKLHGYADIILIDTGAGLTKESQQCHLSADEVILLTTPEPTSISDAYSVVKILHSENPAISFQLVVNRVKHAKEGVQVASKFKMVVQSFLDKEIKIFGAIPDDSHVVQAVLKQVPFSIAYPRSAAAVMMKKLAERFVSGKTEEISPGGMKGFIRKLTRILE
ncbi:MinD/ParA family protein [Bacillus sp. B15-48]|uniref:MinD/ParA family protein n=1 Tax=Bacillus sp. B15-48 TaxID=1548601 RepID=UPI00193F87BD|nr:MinD/ParA family protein [Bacillus sp. B15-48]MBM4764150.1 P-loop NTPase [Bacillus sp. B15-48]